MNNSLSSSNDDDTSVSLTNNNIDDLASDTLAEIHKTQGEIDAAIDVYKRLTESNEEKKDYYNAKIDNLRKQKGNTDD